MKNIFILYLLSASTVEASNFSQFFSSNSSSLGGSVSFLRDNTWVVPDGVTKITVQVTGAGGGGTASGYNFGGGGGGGSCLKKGATVLAEAEGGRGANYNEISGKPGSVTSTVVSVTPGDTLTVLIGGGGGGGGYSTTANNGGGGGGYGPCGIGGAGGSSSSAAGGTGGQDYGGGGGASGTVAGGNAATSTGGTGANGGVGGTATAGGAAGTNSGGGGGASGGIGGFGGGSGAGIPNWTKTAGYYGTNSMVYSGHYMDGSGTYLTNCSGAITLEPGAPGVNGPSCYSYKFNGIGGAGGKVVISW